MPAVQSPVPQSPSSRVAPRGADRRASGCAAVSRAAGEPIAGTASPIRSWLLVEHDGPWGADVRERVLAEAFDPAGLAHLNGLWTGEGLRPLVIRRPAAAGGETRRGHRPGHRPRTVLVGHARPDGGWLERLEVGDLRELRDLDLAALAAGRAGHGDPVTGPALLVCTHGAKDMCCAISGRPVASALRAKHPELTWEVTHVGGDRFAGNLVIAPYGLYYGQLDPSTALHVADEVLARRVPLTALRGRTLWAPAGQWAEAELRRRTGATALGDVVVEHIETDADGQYTITLRGPHDDSWSCRVSKVPQAHVTSSCAGTSTISRFLTHSLARS